MMSDEQKEKILNDILRYIDVYPPMEPGDVTVQDIAERYGLEYKRASEWMKKVVRTAGDVYEMVKVSGPRDARCRWVWVLRKRS